MRSTSLLEWLQQQMKTIHTINMRIIIIIIFFGKFLRGTAREQIGPPARTGALQ